MCAARVMRELQSYAVESHRYHAILEDSIGQILPWQQEEGNLPVMVVEQSLIVGHVMHAISSFVPSS